MIENVAPRPRSKKRKYFFTPEQDALIRRTYERGTGTFKGRARIPVICMLAARLGVPKWRLCRRALEINAYQPRVKEPPWSDSELHLLELNAHLTPLVIRRKLLNAGFLRSENGIKLKLSRLHLKLDPGKYSADALAKLFGIDASTVADQWIRKGLLTATRKGTLRTPQQGGDAYLISEKDIRAFIIDNIGIIDLRKVDKWWFVALLTGDTTHL